VVAAEAVGPGSAQRYPILCETQFFALNPTCSPPPISPRLTAQLEKRLKAGKITAEEYRREMGALNRELGLSDDDEDVILGVGAKEVAGAADGGSDDDEGGAAAGRPAPSKAAAAATGGRPPHAKRPKKGR
jgi:hypothetical protein